MVGAAGRVGAALAASQPPEACAPRRHRSGRIGGAAGVPCCVGPASAACWPPAAGAVNLRRSGLVGCVGGARVWVGRLLGLCGCATGAAAQPHSLRSVGALL